VILGSLCREAELAMKNRPARGARNLLLNCAGAHPGDRLLIATEPPELGYFDGEVAHCIAGTARELGLSVDIVDVGFNPDNPHLGPGLLSRFEAADIILFLSRLGDQLRFSDMPKGKTIVVSFAVNAQLLGSCFGTVPHDALVALKQAADRALAEAVEVRVTCPAGTDVTGRTEDVIGARSDTTIRRFPLSVFTPIPGKGFTGRVALRFLTGTGSRYYPGYNLEFDQPIHAVLDDGRLTGFEGHPADTARASAHYDAVAHRFGIDRNAVHSWHAGIHPGCGYPWDIHDNFERWGGAAFGNPRILHFHTCGAYAPGEISWNVIDPTIEVDGLPIWEQGVFHAERLPEGPGILARYPCAAASFAAPDPEIGLALPGYVIADAGVTRTHRDA